ncbi:hypothetical protein [Asticcacaulis solisilvae]|uniref:hypothetical protein n=1 Tax=Asticcacaulis solisilvae TaxID=1217274 RepID=UPI003FD709CB
MKLKDDLGATVRTLYFLVGVVLAAATIASAWSEWPGVSSGKESPLGFGLLMIVAMPLSLFVIVWACVGRHREWKIGDDGVRIRLLSLTSWQKDLRVRAGEIETLTREQYNYDDNGGRVAYGVTMTLLDGKTYRSPRTFDAGQAEQAWQRLERLKAATPVQA